MKWVLYVFGITWVAFGTSYILYTKQVKDRILPLLRKANPKILSVIPIIFGILLILSAIHSLNSWFIIVLGLLAIIKGLLFIITSKKFYEAVIDWYFEKASDQTSRFVGVIAIIIGTAVLSWIK